MKRAIVVLAILSLGLAASFFSFTIKGTVQPIHTGVTLELSDKLKIGQSFVARNKNLSKIDIYTAAGDKKHKGDVVLRLYEDSANGPLLRTAKISAAAIKGDMYLRFPIKILHNTEGKRLYFEVDAKDVKPADVRVWFYSVPAAYQLGSGFANEGELGGDVQFRTYHMIGFYDWAFEYGQRIAAKKPGIAGMASLYLAFLLVIIMIFAYLLAQIMEEPKGTAVSMLSAGHGHTVTGEKYE